VRVESLVKRSHPFRSSMRDINPTSIIVPSIACSMHLESLEIQKTSVHKRSVSLILNQSPAQRCFSRSEINTGPFITTDEIEAYKCGMTSKGRSLEEVGR